MVDTAALLAAVGLAVATALAAVRHSQTQQRRRTKKMPPSALKKQQRWRRQQPPCASRPGRFPPTTISGAFDPADLLGCEGKAWKAVLLALSENLPVQMHMEPYYLRAGGPEAVAAGDSAAPPLFRRTVALLDGFPGLADLMCPDESKRRGRIKFRLSGRGKFIHRNRYERRNIICCLDGEQHWLLLDTTHGAHSHADGTFEGGAADEFLGARQNKNWNGFRSNRFPKMLSVEEMHEIARDAPPGVEAHVIKVKAGDIFSFDGRWWHATSYTRPVLSLFFTPGENMEVALAEHRKRMAMPLQQGLKIATVNMAKCAKLASSWKKDVSGGDMMRNWAPDMDQKT